MQPSHTLLPATSYPKTVGNVLCYNRVTTNRVKTPISNYPINGQGSQTIYPSMYSTDKLSQHAITHSQAREARHAIPACIVQTSYSSMQSPNHRPGKPNKLSQHAVAKPHDQSQAREARQATPAFIVQTSYPSMHYERYTV